MRGLNIPKKIKISLKNLQNKVPLHLNKIRHLTRRLPLYKKPYLNEITVVFVDDRKIRALNKRFLKINRSTDVLAFAGGDIIISSETAQKNADYFRTSFESEICLYIVHGFLHLLGYNDKKVFQRSIMRKKEQEILKSINDKL